jgi:predicted RNA-binding protein YlxR (DUF448 family)
MPERKLKPQRTCIGCRQRDAQDAMARIAMRAGVAVVDERRQTVGRGGYLHRDAACLAKFVGSKMREFRSLKHKLTMDDRRRLVAEIGDAAGQLYSAEIK